MRRAQQDGSGREGPTLRPRLVPEPLWGLSAYRLFNGRGPWRRIRTQALAEAKSTCCTCGVVRDSRMHCDEDWHYDEATGVALLTRFRILCPDCDAVIHIGLTGTRGYAPVSYEHMARVNGTSAQEARVVCREAMLTFHRLSARSWSIAVAP